METKIKQIVFLILTAFLLKISVADPIRLKKERQHTSTSIRKAQVGEFVQRRPASRISKKQLSRFQ